MKLSLYSGNDVKEIRQFFYAVFSDSEGEEQGLSVSTLASDLRKKGVELLFTYGSPQYYSKVDFSPVSEELAKAPVKLSLPFAWLGQSLVSDDMEPIRGDSRCVEALNNPEYW